MGALTRAVAVGWEERKGKKYCGENERTYLVIIRK